MKFIFLIVAFLLILRVGFSSEEQDSAIQLQLAWSDRIAAIKKTISEHAPIAAAELKQVKINPVDSGDIGRVYAYRRDGIDNIDVSLGFLAMLNQLVTAFQSLPTSQAVSYLTLYVHEVKNRGNADKYAGPIPSPLDWAGWSKEEKECVENDSEKINEIGRLETATASFVICHELGHLVLGHWKTPPKSPAESQARETAADKFASDTLIASDVGPVVGMYALIFYAVIDTDLDVAEQFRTHPMSIVRIEALINAELDHLNSLTISSNAGVTREELGKRLQKASQILKDAIANHNILVVSSEPLPRGGTIISEAKFYQNDSTASDAISQEGEPSIEWHTSADLPTVHYLIRYKNESSKRIECLIKVAVGAVPRDKNAAKTWEEVSKNTHHFVLAPDRETTVQGTLKWIATPTLMPQIRYPDPSVDELPEYYRCRLK